MSFWSDLYAGDAAKIAQAFNDEETIVGKPFVFAHVNLPGVVPDGSGELANSPNVLTELACSTLGVDPFAFADTILQQLAGDPDPMKATNGAYAIAPKWGQLFASLSDDQARALARRWLKECDPEVTEDQIPRMTSLLLSIADVCRAAQDAGASLVYTWSM